MTARQQQLARQPSFPASSGRRAFSGDTGPETLTAILKHEPTDVGTISAPVPPALERIVRRCLEKKPELRFQSAHDLVFALSMIHSPSSGTTPVGGTAMPAPSAGKRERYASLAATGVLALAAVVTAATPFSRPSHQAEPPRVVSSSLLPPPNTSLSSIAISPDGRWLAFAAVTGGKTQLWVRPLESPAARALSGSEGATMPFWSPDSRFIGFAANGKLKRIAVTGGAAQTLCDAGVFFGGAWNRDGTIVFSMAGFGLLHVSATGGEPTTLMPYESANYQSPSFLPDGQRFLYTMLGARQDINGVFVGSLDGTGGSVSPDGRWLVYASDEAGEYAIYVTSFPDAKGKRQLSAGGGIGPAWRKDGKELFFYSRDGQLMSVEVNATASFSASAPRALFEFRSGNGLSFVAPFAAAADGQRFLIHTIVDESNGAPLTLVSNWPELLRR